MNAQRQRAQSVPRKFHKSPNVTRGGGEPQPRAPFYENIAKPSLIFEKNSSTFLRSLRPLEWKKSLRSDLARYYRLSRLLVDDFVQVKSKAFDRKMDRLVDKRCEVNGETHQDVRRRDTGGGGGGDVVASPSRRKIIKKTVITPKSAGTSNSGKLEASLHQTSAMSQSSPGLNQQEEGDDDDDCDIEPMFHRSLDRISSIANWEKQVRYELEIERELQHRELERRKERLEHDQRKLEERDRALRIELDARERKLRLGEEQLKTRLEEMTNKTGELERRQALMEEIVNERLKVEMRAEVERLRKKFNELEMEKTSLGKKEERLRQAEGRLHEQVKLVKEKIDSKRTSDMHMAKTRKELDIVRKENEALRDKIESMEDYRVTKYENKALKNELAILKQTLEARANELERDRDRCEREQRAGDHKIAQLKGELRNAILQRQRTADDLEQMSTKYEAISGQVTLLKAINKNLLAQINQDFCNPQALQTHSSHSNLLTKSHHNVTSFVHHKHHSREHSFHALRSSRVANNHKHARSISMDGGEQRSNYWPSWSAQNRGNATPSPRGCHLCDDKELDDEGQRMMMVESDQDNDHHNHTHQMLAEEEEDEDGEEKGGEKHNRREGRIESPTCCEDENKMVESIVNEIYDRIANGTSTKSQPTNVPKHDEITSKALPKTPETEVNTIKEKQTNGRAHAAHRSLYDELIASTELLQLDESRDKVPKKAEMEEETKASQSNDPNNNQVKIDTFGLNESTTTLPQAASANGHSTPSSISESFEIDW